jgi:hypothetical protein
MSRRVIVYPDLPNPRSNITALGQGQLRVQEDSDNGENYVGFKAPTSIGNDVTWTLPSSDGSDGEILTTDGSGTLSWGASGGIGYSWLDLNYPFIGVDAGAAPPWTITFPNSTQSSHNNFTYVPATGLITVGETGKYRITSNATFIIPAPGANTRFITISFDGTTAGKIIDHTCHIFYLGDPTFTNASINVIRTLNNTDTYFFNMLEAQSALVRVYGGRTMATIERVDD